ncbi:cytochrome b/b6 domain-containing protein [Candidatus Endoriftia persephone]|uniref:Cytochrome b561/thiosulfate reductase, cytochrome B subunit n=3 Tax=Gammaproteobacteria TaxID=1236 RepID=G2FJF3_9GAMM|nr:cytochrome b/b6 domain-containing protein [Candidatus Endoriftia persephone]EGV50679.1 putative hydrogenase, b-type cytochrome subunit [endosymbiont of Riftia pachyptila (vent Ph05)]EGW53055.1 cytochrome b561/thiosulfate reductase, cytochrome B subunit [endosymbiont of Tevnia jerichonana (vent Tica)]USF87780.1 cytochrome b/b6 domain-containing protein [Candidatus Endoriftia persephone]
MTMHKILVFKRFERIWHWSQMALIFTLLFSGFAVHGVHSLINFGDAVTVHTWTAIVLLLIWAFAIFWLFTTGQWRHYIPTGENFIKVARFYAFGIFKGEHHPYRKTYRRKHNPLQALTYLLLKIMIFPAIWISGIAYLLISFGQEDIFGWIGLGLIALIHTIAAIAVLVFVIAHVYLLTTGHSFIDHVKPMITGYDDVELSDEELAYLKADEPGVIKEAD